MDLAWFAHAWKLHYFLVRRKAQVCACNTIHARALRHGSCIACAVLCLAKNRDCRS